MKKNGTCKPKLKVNYIFCKLVVKELTLVVTIKHIATHVLYNAKRNEFTRCYTRC